MSVFVKGGLSLVAVSGGCTGVYFGIRHFGKTTETFKDKLTTRLLSATGESNKKEGESRLTSLRGDKVKNDSLTSELKTIKDTTSKTGEDLRNLCSIRVNEPYEKEGEKLKEVIDYCTFKNKDKLGEKIITEKTVESKGAAANGILNGKNDGLSQTMQTIKNKFSTDGGTNTSNALKTGCEGICETPGTDDTNSDFEDAKQYCVENSPSRPAE